MRKKDKREKDFQRFVDVGGLKFLEEAEIKKVESERYQARKRQEEEEFMELLGYLLFCVLAVGLIVGAFWLVFSEFGKRMIDEAIKSIMEGRY